jgi:GT2 family glycosyltransferase
VNIWIVIVTYNAEKWIEPCLNSILKNTLKSNVIVVDNLSSDKTVEILKNKYPHHKTILNKRNEGFAFGNNVGIKYALQMGADYVVLLNQDAKLNNDTLEKLHHYAQQYPDYGILAPMFYSYDGTRLDPYLLRWVFSYNNSLASDIFFKRPKDVYDVPLAPAAMWFMRREAIEEAGGFDPLFFMYGEDDDLWRRFRIRGWKAGLFPTTFVYHYTPESSYFIKKRIWYGFATTINALKNKNSSFAKNLFLFFKNYFKNSLNAIIDFNKSELYVTQVVFYTTLMRLSKIAKNRKLSFNSKMPFLN